MKLNSFFFLISSISLISIFSLFTPKSETPPENDETSSTPEKAFSLTRTEVSTENNVEEKFLPYTYTSNIDSEKYIFDTASFYSWKNDLDGAKNDDIAGYNFINKKNEIMDGIIKINSLNMEYIEINSNKYLNKVWSICIPKNFPERLKQEIDNNINNNKKDNDNINNIKYNYLDILSNDLKEEEKYINYIQDSISTGQISFGSKNEIFDAEKNNKEIKSCTCISPPDTEKENEFLNFWNCKIDSFYINNDKMPSSYSISISGEIFAIFAIEEEYIIAPKLTGTEIINYYNNLINNNYDVSCNLEYFKPNIKIMICETFNFAELPDFNILLDGEIYLIAFSFDLFKVKNDTHILFKILLNEANTKEYWYLGDPIIKNYNFLFDYRFPGNETITIVQSDKYESMTIILFFCVSAFITVLFYTFLIIFLVKKLKNGNKSSSSNNIKRQTSNRIKKKVKFGNNFEIPDENDTVQSIEKNNFFTQNKKKENIDNNADEDNNSSINVSKSFEKEKKFESKAKKNNKDTEIELVSLEEEEEDKYSFTDDEENDLNANDEGSIQPFNQTKFKNQ